MPALDLLTIKGFKSIRNLTDLQLGKINILIGANGVGKSNFISFFRMMRELMEQRLQQWVATQGGADRILSFGAKETDELFLEIKSGQDYYQVLFKPTLNGELIVNCEEIRYAQKHEVRTAFFVTRNHWPEDPRGKESYFKKNDGTAEDIFKKLVSGLKIFHFHDTSETAGVKRYGAVHDCAYLRSDASNLAAYLLHLQQNHPETYQQIRQTVALAVPFFDDFVLTPRTLPTEEQQVNLQWRQSGSDYPLWPSQLSDGSIRFICLVTALLQPEPPSTIIIDEPELGLHPYALALLAELLHTASERMQVIVSTQSVPLVSAFSLNDLIVVERENGESTFKRLNEEDFSAWLEDYSVGELWQKNILGGRP